MEIYLALFSSYYLTNITPKQTKHYTKKRKKQNRSKLNQLIIIF